MATAGQFRKKHGPIKARLEQALQQTKDFLNQVIKYDDLDYLETLRNFASTLTKRLGAFQEVEEKLQELSKGNEEETKKLIDRDEAFVLQPTEVEESLEFLRTRENRVLQQKEESKVQAKEVLELEHKKQLDERSLEHDKILEQEREAWKIQLEEMQQLEINRRQEFADKIERVRVENNFELEKQKLELEHKKIEMEDRLRQKEIELKDSIAASTNVLPTSFLGTNSSPSVRNVKLPKLDFPKFSGDILTWKEF